MLVITRKIGEGIIINQDISISILSLKGHSIRLGIKAPHHIQVFRDELFREISRENKKASEVLRKKFIPPDFEE